MSGVLSGEAMAGLLHRSADFIEIVGDNCTYSDVAIGPTADVRTNPANPRKIQIALSSRPEQEQLNDLAQIARILGGPSVSQQVVEPVLSLEIPVVLIEDDMAVTGMFSVSMHEAVFTTADGIDVSLAAMGRSLHNDGEQRMPSAEIVDNMRRYAAVLGGVALPFTRTNIFLPGRGGYGYDILCASFAHVSPGTLDSFRDTTGLEMLGSLQSGTDMFGSPELIAKQQFGNASWVVHVVTNE